MAANSPQGGNELFGLKDNTKEQKNEVPKGNSRHKSHSYNSKSAVNNFRPRLEIEDDNCIQKKKKTGFRVSMKTYRWIKLSLVAAIPVLYFIYSGLLFFVFLALAATLLLTNVKEKELNKGLKKELQSALPKGDSLLAILVIILSIVSILFSLSTSSQRKSMFQGFNQTEIEETIKDFDFEFDKGDMVWREIKNRLRSLGNLSTGERVFFKESRRFGMMGKGMPPDGVQPPVNMENMPTPPKDMSEVMDEIPFSILFSSILKSVNTGLVFLVAVVGAISLVKVRKIED